MTIWFNVKEAREQLLRRGLVYTLRPKRRREGREVLCYDGLGKKGVVYVEFVKEIDDDGELEEYVDFSGFKSVKEWRAKAKNSRYLYKVTLLSRGELLEG